MKRMFSLLLVLLLALSTALPVAAAEGGSDRELEQVTRSVKSTLGLDTDDYTNFRGNYEEGELTPLWYLYWSGDAGSLSVSALADGTVVSYTLNPAETVSRPSTGLPAFPQGDPEEAQAAAEAFLKRVLGSGESVVLEEPTGLDRLDSTTFRFSGTIALNGLPSPLSYSVTVRAADNLVTRFRRDVPENAFLGSIPSATAQTTPVRRRPVSARPLSPCAWNTFCRLKTARRLFSAICPIRSIPFTWTPKPVSWWICRNGKS